MKHLAWIQVLAGLWLIALPFALGQTDNRLLVWSLVASGLVVGITGLLLQAGPRPPRTLR